MSLTSDIIMVRALERGLTLSDFDNMTVGGILDYIYTYNNLNDVDNNQEPEYETTRQATQTDFDRF